MREAQRNTRREKKKGEEIHIRGEQQAAYAYGNSCVQVVEPDFFKLVDIAGPFSLTKSYLDLAHNHKICGFEHNEDYWYDLGRYENFKKAETFFSTE